MSLILKHPLYTHIDLIPIIHLMEKQFIFLDMFLLFACFFHLHKKCPIIT